MKKGSNVKRKGITIEIYKQVVKTVDSLNKHLNNNFNSNHNVLSEIMSDMNISYPLTTQESTSDINCNTYPMQTQTTSDDFDLDAQLQRDVSSIQRTEYEVCVLNMEVACESHPFMETNVAPIVEPVLSANTGQDCSGSQ